MYRYTAYGLTIRSAFELPELPRIDDGLPADIVFRRDDVDPVPQSVAGTGRRRIQAEPGRCRFSYDGIGSFLVEHGHQVSFQPATQPASVTKPRKIVRRLFANEMLGLVLHQRGDLVLHASAVAVDGNAALFLGPKGAGKSTTAVAFHEHGYPVLEDDLVGIRFDGSQPMVVPGVPQVRLLPDAIDGLKVDGTTRPASDADSEKRYKQVTTTRDPAPVSRCYFLRDGTDLSFEPVAPRSRVVRLVSQTYTGGLLEDTDATADNFRRCTAVAETGTFRTLYRPTNHDSLPTLVDRVAADLRSGDTTDR
ncbi:hypothetical protein D8Y22_07985 [Salinadaptatus halalkaliphilus]|uniref:Serine kinase n=1 Tax=Salinadaptatus halalkaliphilus TaxID=2419781 RepID=A0A4S3TPK9_9EURY|nr:hypothetical protein [Salinadaptatus halalkaliphilus]THE65153.1 hypothetical protein D8Y22_07985 [Salinadaptatus halalkaliphilus]